MAVTNWPIRAGNQRWASVETDVRYDYKFARRTFKMDRDLAILWLARGYGVPWDRMIKWADDYGLR